VLNFFLIWSIFAVKTHISAKQLIRNNPLVGQARTKRDTN